ncbi:MAG: helix-turn-helix domain-containing protein [Thermoanaerobacteraceae bacterium]
MQTIGERIRYARKNKNLTIPALNKLTGLSVGNLSDLENNKSMPSSNALIKLKKALDVSIDWLLLGNENNYICKEDEIPYDNETYYILNAPLKDKILFMAFEELPDDRKRDIEGYMKVSLKTTDLNDYFKNRKDI